MNSQTSSNNTSRPQWKDYLQLAKLRLSVLVVFCSVLGYLMTPLPINLWILFCVGISGFFITASANTLNQIFEKDIDLLMKRTNDRPLPTNRLSILEAYGFAIWTGLLGFLILYSQVNTLATLISFVSLILYAFVYTPLKKHSPLAVFVGAFPGAFPPLIGWVSGTNDIDVNGLALFAVQFVWQFPHFWAIAWVGHEDYANAGYYLLPSGGEKDLYSAILIFIYSLILIPISVIPLLLGISGMFSAVICILCGIFFLWQAIQLIRKRTKEAALKIMFASFLYLPIVQLALFFDKTV